MTGAEAEDELERAKETIATLRGRTAELLEAKEAAEKDAEALKRQAKGLSDEYARVLAQKVRSMRLRCTQHGACSRASLREQMQGGCSPRLPHSP